MIECHHERTALRLQDTPQANALPEISQSIFSGETLQYAGTLDFLRIAVNHWQGIFGMF
jgi:hypothetical protein